jgi:formiminotetrahydrofolate cyclodeaminase
VNVSHAPLADRTLADVLTALASDAASPGSGAAAAVALSFAAACAGKALAISRKHRPESSQGAEQRAADLIRRSLERADADAKHFEEFIHHKSAQAANELLCAD